MYLLPSTNALHFQTKVKYPFSLSKVNLSLCNLGFYPFLLTFWFHSWNYPLSLQHTQSPSISLFHPPTNMHCNLYQINTFLTLMSYICKNLLFLASYIEVYTPSLLKRFLSRSPVTSICQIHGIYPDLILFSSLSIYHSYLNTPTKLLLPGHLGGSWLNVQLSVLSQTVISGWWHQAPHQAPCSAWNLLKTLSPSPFAPTLNPPK